MKENALEWQWERKSNYTWAVVSEPQYMVTAFKIEDVIIYRSSLMGEFIGAITRCPDTAKQICQNNFIIQGGTSKGVAEG